MMLESQPNLDRYQYQKNEKYNSIKYAELCMNNQDQNAQGSILNDSNPLLERMKNFQPNHLNRGGYYILQNVQLQKNEADFRDIFITMERIDDEEKH